IRTPAPGCCCRSCPLAGCARPPCPPGLSTPSLLSCSRRSHRRPRPGRGLAERLTVNIPDCDSGKKLRYALIMTSPSTGEQPVPEQPLTALEALPSTISRRYLAPDPIPEDVLWAILDAAIRGPSGGNTQEWGWVVVTDPETKKRVAPWYRENFEKFYGRRREQILAA